ncbi:MAG: arginine--tRNA ligase [Acidimicrobiia bacterium]
MKSLLGLVEDCAKEAVEKATGQDTDPIVRWSTNPKFGDIQINAAMNLGKQLGKNPRDVANDISNNLNVSIFSDKQPEIAGPGFINISLSLQAINSYAKNLLLDEHCGVNKVSVPKNIVVDYGGANIAKEMHIGHLRSAIIGDALNRVFSFLGHNVTKQDHLGDWGTQFGMLVEFLVVNGEIPETLPELSDLDTFYKQAQSKFKTDEDFATKARARVALLQGGDSDSLRAWKHIYNETMTHLLIVYKRLGILLTDADSRGESFYNNMLSGICEELVEKNIATQSEGALVIYKPDELDRDGNPFGLIIRKSDGGYGYATTDLAAIKYAVESDRADEVVYAVDARQSQHFEIVFWAAQQAGWLENTELFHAAFGTVLGLDGKPFKTRSGDVVKLKELIDEAQMRASELVKEKNSDLPFEQSQQLASDIGVGAIKYADLSNNRIKNYVFDWDRMLTMEGNTAPYLQYAIARINSLLRNASSDDIEFSDLDFSLEFGVETELIKELSKFNEVLIDVADSCEPHRLCTYLFNLAQTFTSFYENKPVLKEENHDLRKSRLAICYLTARTLRKGLELLGINSPERM